MFSKLSLIFLILSGCCNDLFAEQLNGQQVTYLHTGIPHVQDALTVLQTLYSQNRVHIYCRRDQPLRLRNIFQSNRLQLISKAANTEYIQYRASTAQGVYDAHKQRRECYEGKFLAGRAKRVHYISLSAHAHSCYGIYTDQAYNLTLLQERCDKERLVRFMLGVGLWVIEATTIVGESLICVYCVAAVMGIHLASVVVVCVALMCHGDHKMRSIQPLSTNFKLVLEQFPTSVAVSLVAGAFMLVNACQDYQDMWTQRWVRRAHCRFLRLLAYLLILGASNDAKFGWICVSLLLPWPELWWVLQWIQLKFIKLQRKVMPPMPRNLLSEREFEAQAGYETQRALSEMRQRLRATAPDWEQLAQLQAPQQFAQFLSSGTHEPEKPKWRSGTEMHSRHVQTAEPTDPDPEATMLRHLAAVMNSDSSHSARSSSASADSFCRQLHCTGSTRSLQDGSRMYHV
ncbi:uncharacterized protein LOC111602246 [Drosophila hydei]|uniref:Uncharacterized protein LOC111602246 n=1 Tax=Drosophila hydei TaxID=7224 RepID=A0A6J1MDE1_DROHY|nr:uncharacterized protein LOC111602246 [Drosophila hydei]